MTNLEKRLLDLQQKIACINAEIADLIALTSDLTPTPINDAKSLAKRPTIRAATTQVGLTRFRQLAEEAA